MASDLANLMNAELKEAFDAFDKVSVTSAAAAVVSRVLYYELRCPGRERHHLLRGAAGRDARHGPEPHRGRAAQPRAGGGCGR